MHVQVIKRLHVWKHKENDKEDMESGMKLFSPSNLNFRVLQAWCF